MMERQRPQSKVSLEDLIRLKRAERPPQEFWSEFESQLRHKQLAAIVDKRPWWRRFSTTNLAKLSLPVGATAIVALTLMTYRDLFQAVPATSGPVAALATDTQLDASVGTLPDAMTGNSQNVAFASASQRTADATASRETNSTERSHVQGDSNVSQESEVLIAQAEKETSLAQAILGIEGESGGDRPRFDATALLAELSTVHAQQETVALRSLPSAEIDPLAGIASSMDARRARLLVSVDSSERGNLADNPRVARTRDRIASRLNEQALSDSIRRLGLNGDSVSIKF
jgi:hypothetical protein